MNISLPSRYVKLPAREVYAPDLSDAHFRTLAHIRGLAARSGGQRTPPLTVEGLAAIRRVSRAALFKHLGALRAAGYIRTQLIGNCQFVVHLEPVRITGPQAVILRPTCTRSGAGEAGESRLTGQEQDPSAQGDNGYPDRLLVRRVPGAAPQADGRDGFAEGEEGARPGRRAGASLHGETGGLKDATGRLEDETPHVVDSCDSVHKDQPHHEAAGLNNETEPGGLLDELAGLLAGNGMAPEAARAQALKLLKECGADVCARQRGAFERRCELARASRQGLRNPIGLLCASIQEDWPLPAPKNEKTEGRWYSDEEFEAFFEHPPG